MRFQMDWLDIGRWMRQVGNVVLPRRDGFKRYCNNGKVCPGHHRLPAARRKVWSASLNGATVRQGVQVANNSSLNFVQLKLYFSAWIKQHKRVVGNVLLLKEFCWLLVLNGIELWIGIRRILELIWDI